MLRTGKTHGPMASSLHFGESIHARYVNLLQRSDRWIHKWDPDLDRLEDFASNLGTGYTKRLDVGLLAMGAGLLALLALAIGS